MYSLNIFFQYGSGTMDSSGRMDTNPFMEFRGLSTKILFFTNSSTVLEIRLMLQESNSSSCH